ARGRLRPWRRESAPAATLSGTVRRRTSEIDEMMLSLFVAALALQAPKPAPAAKPDPKPAAKPDAKPAPEGGFRADFDEAVNVAKEEHKDLLVDFTGSDWCIWCKKLHSEVFDFDSFLDGADEKFVLVALDYPHSDEAKKLVPNAKRNDELMKK